MTKYLNNSPFSVPLAGDQNYRDNWDNTFAKKVPAPDPKELARLADDGGIPDSNVTGCIVENYSEGEPAPRSSEIEANAEKIDVDVKVFYTEKDEQQFVDLVTAQKLSEPVQKEREAAVSWLAAKGFPEFAKMLERGDHIIDRS